MTLISTHGKLADAVHNMQVSNAHTDTVLYDVILELMCEVKQDVQVVEIGASPDCMCHAV
jgi:hypothetical protein